MDRGCRVFALVKPKSAVSSRSDPSKPPFVLLYYTLCIFASHIRNMDVVRFCGYAERYKKKEKA